MIYNEKLVLKKLKYIISKNNIDPSDIDIEIDYPAGAVEKWLSGEKNADLTNTLGNYLENNHNIKFTENKFPKIIIILSIIIISLLTLMICSIILISSLLFFKQKNNDKNNKEITKIEKNDKSIKADKIDKNNSSGKTDSTHKDTDVIKKNEKIEIEIIDPKNGEKISIDRIQILGDDQISIYIKIGCKNEDLIPEGSYLSCIASVLSGAEVYVTGKSTSIISDQMMMDYVTLGSLEDENKFYELFVIIGNEKLTSGTTYSAIPDHIVRSKKITIEINKKELKKNLKNK